MLDRRRAAIVGAVLVIGGAGYPLGPLFGVAFINLLSQNIIPALIPSLNETLPRLLPFINPVNIFAALSPLLFGLSLVVFLIAVSMLWANVYLRVVWRV